MYSFSETPNQPTMPRADVYRLVTASLNTTLAETAVGLDRAARLLNCDTGHGDWRIDRRHRRFLSPPTSTESTSCTPYSSGTVTSVARVGSAGAWANPGNAETSDDSYSVSPVLGPGESTDVLRVTLLVPAGSIDATGTLTIRVERQADPDTGGVGLAVSDLAQLTLAGSPLGPPFPVGDGLPDSDVTLEYTADLAALGVTPEQVMAGDVGVDLGWKNAVDDPGAFDPDNWIVEYTGVGLTVLDGTSMPWATSMPWGGETAHSSADHLATSEGDATIRATWQGNVDDAPPCVGLSVTTTLSALTTDQSYLAQGSTAPVTTKTYVVPVVDGVATLVVHMGASGRSYLHEIEPQPF